jgi:hypothetical protein
MPITLECNTDDLEILLDSARESGDCVLILHTTDGETVCLRARHKKPGRPRRVQPAAAGLTPQAESEHLQAIGKELRANPNLTGTVGA